MAAIFPWFSLPSDKDPEVVNDSKVFTHNKVSNFVHSRDAGFVNNLITPDPKGPWIAGGACLAWYQNKPCATDIDLYFRNRKQLEKFEPEFRQAVSSYNGGIYNEIQSDNARTLVAEIDSRKFKVQLIWKEFFDSPKSVIDSFDITVCQIAWDGQQVYYTSSFVNDFAKRQLRFHNINHQSHKRLVKYMVYGYELDNESLKQLINSDKVDWDAKGNDHYA